MHKELTKDAKTLVISLVIFTILLKIAMVNEPFFSVARIALGWFWLFAIPGMMISYVLLEKLESLERVIIGSVIGAAVVGILSYYAGLIGFHTKFHGFFFPPVIAALSYFAFFLGKKEKRVEKDAGNENTNS